MMRFGVIGYGYWGPNIVRNLAELPDVEVACIADCNPARLALARKRHPSASSATDARDVFLDPSIDAVVVATPVRSHFRLAMEALRHGKHVLVEKPLCPSSIEAEQLIETAAARGLTLMVDHTFPYTGAVRKVRQLIDSGEIGQVYYYDSVRINLGLFQEDVSVLWDLAVHDLSIMEFVLQKRPQAVACTGSAHLPGHPEDIAYMTLYFAEGLIAHFHVNWLSPVKLRRTLIGGDRKMIVYDDLEPYEKVRVHDKGLVLDGDLENTYHTRLRGYRTGDVWAPEVDLTEALRTELTHFIRCAQNNETPITDGQAGLRVVRLLEAASLSLSQKGAPVEVMNHDSAFRLNVAV